MRKTLLALTLVFIMPVAANAALSDLMSQAETAFGAHDYQKAENLYVDAMYEAKGADAEKSVIIKLDQLYKESGLSPLDSTIKEKLQRFRAAKEAGASKTSKTASGSGAKSTYEPIFGTVSEKLLAAAKTGVESSCKANTPGFRTLESYQGSVYKLPDGTFQILSSFNIVTQSASAPYDFIGLVEMKSDGMMHFLKNDLQPRLAADTAQKRGPSAFDRWVADEKNKNAAVDKATRDQSAQAEASTRLSEQQQLEEMERQRKALEAIANSSTRRTPDPSQSNGQPGPAPTAPPTDSQSASTGSDSNSTQTTTP